MYKLKKQSEIHTFNIPVAPKSYVPVEGKRTIEEETKPIKQKNVKIGGAYETINNKPSEIKESVNLKKFIEINL